MELAIGIDIGGTNTKLAAIDSKGKFWGMESFETALQASESIYFETLSRAVATLMGNIDQPVSYRGIGIGAPSCIPELGIIKQAANLPFSEEVDIVKYLESRFDLPARLIKDGNASALGEGLFGGAVGMTDYVVITLGTGLGCGMIINNQIVSGRWGKAGELGHTLMIENGRDCKCGRKGCLETYVSANGIKRTLFQLLASSTASSGLRKISFETLSPKMIFEAAAAGDVIAKEAFHFTGNLLGRKLADLMSIFEPEAFFLAGGLADAGDYLFQPTKTAMEKNMLEFYRNQIKVLPSSLNLNEAALLGAVSLVWKNIKQVSHA